MTSARERMCRLRLNDRGATIIEFALISGPMVLLLMGGLEFGYNSYVRASMQGALNDAARIAAVEFPVINVEGDTLGDQVETLIKAQVQNVAPNAEIKVTPKSYFDFSNINNPEVLTKDRNGNGVFDFGDKDCFIDVNGNGVWDIDAGTTGNGGASDVVFYTADVSAPRLLPIDGFLPGVGPTIEFTLKTAVRNQPYDHRENPGEICGHD